VCARVFQFFNQHVAEFHEMWYEANVTGGHINACMWWLQNVLGIVLFLRNTKQCNHLSQIPFKIVPTCNYTLLPATVRVLETCLEAIL
jgi:hypothetical protein